MSSADILFCGDYAPCDRYAKLVDDRGGEIFGDLRQDILKADLAFLNIEAPLCPSNLSPIAKSGPALRADKGVIRAAREAGFSIACLANNHIMDYGQAGLESTLMSLRRENFHVVGAGVDAEAANRPLRLTAKGIRIAIIAVAEHEFSIASEKEGGAAVLDPINVAGSISECHRQGDLVIVSIHGGNEYFRLPRPGLRRVAKFFVENGAHAIVCHHPHVAGAYEYHKNAPILYSLGNLIFDHRNPPPGWREGCAVKMTLCDGDSRRASIKRIDLIPYQQAVEFGGIRKLTGESLKGFLAELDHLLDILSDKDRWMREWDEYCERRRDDVVLRQFLPYVPRGLGRIARRVPIANWVLPRRTVARRLNMVRCESHLEVLTALLEKRMRDQ